MEEAGTTEADQEGLDPTFRVVVEDGQTVPGGNKMVLNMIDKVLVTGMTMEDTDQIMIVGVETAEVVILTITTTIDKVVVLDGGVLEVEITLGLEVEFEVVATQFLRGAVWMNGHRDVNLVLGIIFHQEAGVEIIFHQEVEATMGHLVVGQEDEDDHVALAGPAVEAVMALEVMAAVIIALPQVEVATSAREVEAIALMRALLVGPLAGVDLVEAPMGGAPVVQDPRAPVKVLAQTLA